MFIEDEPMQIMWPQRYVSWQGDGDRSLRLGQRAKIRLLIALHLRSRAVMADRAGAPYGRVVELVHGAPVLCGQSTCRHRHLERKPAEFGQGRGIDLHPFAGDLH